MVVHAHWGPPFWWALACALLGMGSRMGARGRGLGAPLLHSVLPQVRVEAGGGDGGLMEHACAMRSAPSFCDMPKPPGAPPAGPMSGSSRSMSSSREQEQLDAAFVLANNRASAASAAAATTQPSEEAAMPNPTNKKLSGVNRLTSKPHQIKTQRCRPLIRDHQRDQTTRHWPTKRRHWLT
jgi:hypothetical protein